MRHAAWAFSAVIAAALGAVVSVSAQTGGPAPATAWKRDPGLDARLADLKAKTAAMVAAQGPLDRSEAALDRAPVIWRVPGAPATLWHSPDAPEMVVVPAGEYTMGWRADAPVQFTPTPPKPGQATRHRVRIAYPLAVSKYPVTVGQFARFVAETGYGGGSQCQTSEDGIERPVHTWRNPNIPQTDRSPVVCVNYDDSLAYIAWLSKKTGKPYRLPSDAEYEYFNRAGTTTTYWWGDAVGTNNASCGGACGSPWDAKNAPPVGSFKPNPFGLYDTTGAVWSRTADCWSETYEDAPFDGSANLSGDCGKRVFRAGGYRSNPLNLRSALRHGNGHWRRFNDDGFHVVLPL